MCSSQCLSVKISSEKNIAEMFCVSEFPIDVLTFGKSLGNDIFSPFPIGFPIFIHVWFIGNWKEIKSDEELKKIQEDEWNLKACMSIYEREL